MTDRPLMWLDTETTGLHDARRAWDVAAIVRPHGGTRADDIEFACFVDIADLDLEHAEPDALAFGRFWERHPQADLVPLVGTLAGVVRKLPETMPQGRVCRESEMLDLLAGFSADAIVHGSNPAFDIQTLGPRLAAHDLNPRWHYHPEDVPSVARGWLLGRGHLNLPRKSDQISALCGIDPTRYDRHTALGDCRWMRDLTDLVEAPSAGVGGRASGEGFCHRCGGPNRPWSAPSPLWNAVMRGGSINGVETYDGIVCPTCFVILAEEGGIADLWRLHAERVSVPLETVTPSGRVWDERTWMWRDPAVVGAAPTPHSEYGAYAGTDEPRKRVGHLDEYPDATPTDGSGT